MFEVGDIVQFNNEGLPDLKMHVNGQDESWQTYFGGARGMVDVSDPNNNQVRVRGSDASGNPFVTWIDNNHLTLVRKGTEF